MWTGRSGAGHLGEESGAPANEYLAGPRRIVKDPLQLFQVRLSPWTSGLPAASGGGPASLEAYVLYARASWEQELGTRRPTRPVALLTKALDAEPKLRLGARVHWGSPFTRPGTGGRVGEICKAIQLNPKFPHANRLLGDILVSSPRRPSNQAIQSYQEALQLSPDYAEAQVGLGDAARRRASTMRPSRSTRRPPPGAGNARVHYGWAR